MYSNNLFNLQLKKYIFVWVCVYLNKIWPFIYKIYLTTKHFLAVINFNHKDTFLFAKPLLAYFFLFSINEGKLFNVQE